jgi:hypothetical protein
VEAVDLATDRHTATVMPDRWGGRTDEVKGRRKDKVGSKEDDRSGVLVSAR